MHWLFLVLLGVLSYLLIVVLPKRLIVLRKLRHFKSPPGLPILGNSLDLNVHKREILKVLSRWVNEYGRRYVIHIGFLPYVALSGAKDVEKVLSSQTQIEKSSDYALLWPWLGLGLLTSGSSKWFHRRKQLTPAFHFKILEDFLKTFNEQTSVLREVLAKQGNEAFDIFPLITHCALDIICETAMGKKIYAQQQSGSDYVKAIYRMSELLQYRQLRPLLHPDFTWNLSSAGREQAACLKILHNFTNSVIQEKKKEREEQKKNESKNIQVKEADEVYMGSGKKRLAFLDLLLEAQETDPSLQDENIREETDTFMFEGHDTTSAAASWATFLIASDPKVQAKVHEELNTIFGNDKTRDITSNDLTNMKYLECCIKEALRIYPSVPFIGRKVIKDLELDDGVVIPAEAQIYVLFHHLHRDTTYFPDAERFDPDRFLPENCQRHPYSYCPFSAGPRNCIGQKFALMEEKVMVSTIFRNFNVEAVDKREDVEVLCELITRPENGLRMKLKTR